MRRIAWLVALISVSAGCAGPVIDGSGDDAALEESLVAVREALPLEQRATLDSALTVIAFAEVDLGGTFASALSGGPMTDPTDRVRTLLDGMSAADVFAAADSITKEIEERSRIQALEEIDELRERQARSEAADLALANVEVTRSRFSKREGFLGAESIIELTVHNRTNYAISRAYFRGRLISPGRSVPWLDEAFNYTISGGLEPDETASWTLSPNMFSDWGTVEAPPDAVLTVTVTRVDGADGEALFESDFGDSDRERLEALVSTWEN